MPNDSEVRTAVAPPGSTAVARLRSLGSGRTGPLVGIVVVIAVLATWPLLAANPYMLSAGVIVLNFAVFATAWNLMGGLTGYVSLGHIAFFGLGSYGTGLAVIHLGINSFVAVLLAAIVVGLISLLVGWAALRVRGASFVIVTIAIVLVLLLVFQSWRSVTGGSSGLVVPRPFPDMLRPEHHRVFFYIFLGLLALVLVSYLVVDRSRLGQALKAIREDEDKAQSLGIPTALLKLAAFGISCFLTAIAGGVYALWFGDLDPIFQFDVVLSSQIALMALLGGVRYLFGPLVGAIIVGSALEYFLLNFGETQFHLVATGLLLVAVVLFAPDGVLALGAALIRRLGPSATSIREMSAADVRAQQDERAAARGAGAGGSVTEEPSERASDD
ncbi:branched-chain amino acid ABC transporter permease [Pseudactinotalea suaedae]|uniref:branched-chain amino acid ABC transporter permease n=1 Tax=Pseudactinotalea suaedae TaxID=1524924 RepID=UPI001F4F35B6|nr:branched-chain amino acid ABC transporter permease [Pseudactinotalea suaedae]